MGEGHKEVSNEEDSKGINAVAEVKTTKNGEKKEECENSLNGGDQKTICRNITEKNNNRGPITSG